MRVLAIIEAESITGPAKNLLEFARLARPLGIEVAVAAFARQTKNAFVEAAQNAGLAAEAIHERHAFDTFVIPALRSAAMRIQPDIIQTHAVKSHFLARLSGLDKLAPWIAFHHGYTQPAARVRFYNQLDRWSLRAARKVITVSIPFREQLIERGVPRERVEIVHNAIDPDWGSAARQNSAGLRASLNIPENAPAVLSVGRLSKEKDHLTLLKAMRRLPTSHLVVVGDGPERPSLITAIQQLGLKDRVALSGHQSSAAPYYSIADVVVISSRSEGSPNVLLEALASGVPLVATRVGGIPEHVADGETALLVDAGDDAAMSAAIERVTEPGSLLRSELMERGKALVRERHAPEMRVRRLIEIYHSVRRG